MKRCSVIVSLTFSFLAVLAGEQKAKAQGEFAAIDKWALAASPTVEKSPFTLCKYLAKGCKNDLERARALYRWITDRVRYDVEWLRDSQRFPLDQTPAGVFQKRKSDCVGYSGLYAALAKVIGLKAASINGFFKLPSHQPGQRVTRTHTWNAVQVGGKWYLLDCTAGAGGVSGDQKFIKQYRDYFFRIDPEAWILSHFPRDPQAQLLKQPVTFRQFEQWPYVDPDLFRLGISARAVHKALGQNMELVEIVGSPRERTKVDQVPLAKFLKQGKKYRFVVRSKDFGQILIRTGDGRFHSLKKDGEVFSGEVIAPSGRLDIGGQPAGANVVYPFLRYAVRSSATVKNDNPKLKYLSDLPEFGVQVAERRFAKNGNLGFGAGGSFRIKVNGKEYPKGISMVPPSKSFACAKYKISKLAHKFMAMVSLNDSSGAPGLPAGVGKIPTAVTFQIVGDGKLLWNSKSVDIARKVQKCVVDVTGVNVLELRVACPGSGVNAHPVWLQPRILLK